MGFIFSILRLEKFPSSDFSSPPLVTCKAKVAGYEKLCLSAFQRSNGFAISHIAARRLPVAVLLQTIAVNSASCLSHSGSFSDTGLLYRMETKTG